MPAGDPQTRLTASDRFWLPPDVVGRAFSRLMPEQPSLPGVAVAFAVYCLVHALARWALSESMNADDVLDAFHGSSFALGYSGLQPPLYVWLIHAAEIATGDLFLATIIVRYVVLWLFYVLFFAAARRALGRADLAFLATIALLMMTEHAFTRHSWHTHSHLISVTVIAAHQALVRILDRPSSASYALFGAAVGIGMLTKHSFAAYLATLMPAALVIAETRARLLDRRMVIALAVAAALYAPYVVWYLKSGITGLDGGLDKISFIEADSLAGQYGEASLNFAQALASYFLPLALLLPLIFGARRFAGLSDIRTSDPVIRLIAYQTLIAAAALLFAFAALLIGRMRARYLHAVFTLVPILLVWLLARRPIDTIRRTRFVGLAVILAVVVLAVRIGGFIEKAPPLCHPRCWESMPYRAFAEWIVARHGATGTVFVKDRVDSGNLRARLPGYRIVADIGRSRQPAGDRDGPAEEPDRPCLFAALISDRDKNGVEVMMKNLRKTEGIAITPGSERTEPFAWGHWLKPDDFRVSTGLTVELDPSSAVCRRTPR